VLAGKTNTSSHWGGWWPGWLRYRERVLLAGFYYYCSITRFLLPVFYYQDSITSVLLLVFYY
jgi:hypothetical protein